MPYWIYNFKIDGETIAKGQKDYRRGNYIYHDHYDVRSDTHANYEGISFDASSSFADSLSGAIAPYNIQGRKPFTEDYMAGFYADTSDISEKVYQKEARDIVKADAANRMMKSGNYHQYGVDAGDVVGAMTPDAEESKMGYFPVWFLSNRTGDRISYAVVNGQTGKVAMDMPISYGKYLLGSLVVAIPIFLMMNVFLTLTPTTVTIIVMILGILAAIINGIQSRRIYIQENYLDDAGMQTKTAMDVGEPEVVERVAPARDAVSLGGAEVPVGLLRVLTFILLTCTAGPIGVIIAVVLNVTVFKQMEQGKSPLLRSKVETAKPKVPTGATFGAVMGAVWKPLIGLIGGLVVLLFHPVSDLYYYGAAMGAMAFVLWSFYDMVRYHNRLATRPLPQFNKRGGDE